MFDGPFGGESWAEHLQALASTPSTPSAFIQRFIDTAVRMLPKFKTGTVAFLRRSDVETGNPLKPFEDGGGNYPVDSYVSGYPSDRIDGDKIQSSDVRIICAAADVPVKPKTDDGVLVDELLLAVVRVEAIPAAGQAALYIVQARAA